VKTWRTSFACCCLLLKEKRDWSVDVGSVRLVELFVVVPDVGMWGLCAWLVTLCAGCWPSPPFLGWPSVLCSIGGGGGCVCFCRLASLNSVRCLCLCCV
jgi:hypothetical protein